MRRYKTRQDSKSDYEMMIFINDNMIEVYDKNFPIPPFFKHLYDLGYEGEFGAGYEYINVENCDYDQWFNSMLDDGILIYLVGKGYFNGKNWE